VQAHRTAQTGALAMPPKLSPGIEARMAQFNQAAAPAAAAFASSPAAFAPPVGDELLAGWALKGGVLNAFNARRFVVLHSGPEQLAL